MFYFAREADGHVRYLLMAVLAVGLISLVSCGVVGNGPQVQSAGGNETATSPQETTTAVTGAAGQSAIVGKVFTTSGGRRALVETPVRAGRIHWNADKSDGAFVFEGASGPSSLTKDDGSFAIVNLPPGDYALMVGDPLARYEVISTGDGKAKVYTATGGSALDVGTLEVTDVP